MKNYLYSILFVALFVGTSCEEVIEIDLNSANPHIVAEAYIEEGEPGTMRLSYTTDYFDVEKPTYIEDSRVEISDDMGNSEILSYMGDGLYRGSSLIGIPEYNYSISFEVDEERYEGSSTLLAPPAIADVSFEESIIQRPTDPGVPPLTSYAITIVLEDESPRDNYFYLTINASDTIPPEYYLVTSDAFKNKEDEIELPLMMFAFFIGETVNLSVYSIDEGAYTFYSEMNDAMGMGMSMMSQPYNSSSNMGKDVLGYFMARSRVDTTVYVY